MSRAVRLVAVSLLACVAACAGEAGRTLLGPSNAGPANAVAGSSVFLASEAGASGCFTPKFNVVLVPSGALRYHGVLTGDLEGTVEIAFDPGSIKFTGVTVGNAGTAQWEITGGIIPWLGAFETTFNNRNLLIDRPGSPSTLFENTGRHRAVAGVEKANLTYTGTFTTVPSPRADHDYQGVICR